MPSDSQAAFPLLGRWKVVKATHHGKEIAEPAQEVEFLPDGTFHHLIESLEHHHIHRFTGTYLFIAPDHFSTVKPEGRSVTQQFTICDDRAESHTHERHNYLERIRKTGFAGPVVDCWQESIPRKQI